MKYKGKYEKLGLAEYIKFGIEIEANNVKTKNGLYAGDSAKFIKSINWHMAGKYEESLVGHGGAELVSPVLHDSEETYKNIEAICEQIKKFPKDKKKEVEADKECGLHIHFDADCLAKHPEKMRVFRTICAEGEEILYKMSNKENNPTRKGAINKDYRGTNIIAALWRNGVAAPTSKKVLRDINNGTLKVSYKKWGKLRTVASKFKLDERRYVGINLTNIGNPNKNTIEFRMSNGTLNPEVIKQNIFLYASIITTAVNIVERPEKYDKAYKSFLRHSITEEEKVHAFLDLIMDSDEDKQIYFKRWESVKDAKVFAKNYKKGFAKTFKRQDVKKIADRVSGSRVREAFYKIKEFVKSKDERREKSEYARQ